MRQDIIVFPDQRLLAVSEPVDLAKVDSDEFRIKVSDLMDTFHKAGSYAVGLSGIQIGWPFRLFLMREPDGISLVANPKIVEYPIPAIEKGEGCLSFPGVSEIVQRHDRIVVEYDAIDFITMETEHVSRELIGLTAQIFQHECDHLDGTVLTDKLTPARAKTIRNRLNKWKMKGYIHP